MSRWILRREEPAAVSLSNAAASLVYVTRCTLDLAEGAYHHAESLDSCQIHTFSKRFVKKEDSSNCEIIRKLQRITR